MQAEHADAPPLSRDRGTRGRHRRPTGSPSGDGTREAPRARARARRFLALVVTATGPVGGAPTPLRRRPATTGASRWGRGAERMALPLARCRRPRARGPCGPLARRSRRSGAGRKSVGASEAPRARRPGRNSLRAWLARARAAADRGARRASWVAADGRRRRGPNGALRARPRNRVRVSLRPEERAGRCPRSDANRVG